VVNRKAVRHYAGLDISITSTGYCIVADDGVIESFGTVESKPGEPDVQRFDKIGAEIIDNLALYSVVGVAIESYAYSIRGKGNFSRIAELGGVVKNKLFRILFLAPPDSMLFVSPSTLKKYATGKGNTHKNLVNKHVFKKWGFDTDSDDVADAYVLSKMCRDFFSAREDSSFTCEYKYEDDCMVAIAKQNNIKIGG
jgi:crossover junction endodeoxyribonuclease RuvC